MSQDLFAQVLAAMLAVGFAGVWGYCFSSAIDQPAVRTALTLGAYRPNGQWAWRRPRHRRGLSDALSSFRDGLRARALARAADRASDARAGFTAGQLPAAESLAARHAQAWVTEAARPPRPADNPPLTDAQLERYRAATPGRLHLGVDLGGLWLEDAVQIEVVDDTGRRHFAGPTTVPFAPTVADLEPDPYYRPPTPTPPPPPLDDAPDDEPAAPVETEGATAAWSPLAEVGPDERPPTLSHTAPSLPERDILAEFAALCHDARAVPRWAVAFAAKVDASAKTAGLDNVEHRRWRQTALDIPTGEFRQVPARV